MRLTSKVLVSAFLACLFAVAPLSGASATDAPSPSASPSAPTEAATPPDGAYVGVTLKNSGAEGEAIPGATLSVSSADGADVGEAVTDPNGRAFIPIPERGSYVVTLDVDTLPAGIEFGGSPERTVNALLDGGNFVQFQIGVAEKVGPPLSERFAAAMVNGVKFGFIIALAALGLSLIFGTTKLTNFSHGELITFGAIATYVANRAFGLPVILAIVAAVVASAAFGWLQDRFLWKPLRSKGIGIIAMMIVSIGFGLFLRNVFQYTFGGSRQSLSQYVNQTRKDYGPFALPTRSSRSSSSPSSSSP